MRWLMGNDILWECVSSGNVCVCKKYYPDRNGSKFFNTTDHDSFEMKQSISYVPSVVIY